jgi:hypothetical protein
VRKLACSLAILWGLMPLLSPGFLVGVHALLASHGHEVSVLTDIGHVDLVFSHAEGRTSEGPHAAEQHLHSAPGPEGGHVVHLEGSEVTRDPTRRGGEVDTQIAGFTLPLPYDLVPVSALACRRERLASTAPLLQTIVLRI